MISNNKDHRLRGQVYTFDYFRVSANLLNPSPSSLPLGKVPRPFMPDVETGSIAILYASEVVLHPQ